MQISVTQAYFMQLLIKINNVKQILEIGTFTGYRALSIALAIDEGFVTCLDNNEKTSEIANNSLNHERKCLRLKTFCGTAPRYSFEIQRSLKKVGWCTSNFAKFD